MAKREWTKPQNDAITTASAKDGKSCNILVGAAAGSGKTAVLVERIIKKLIPDDISKGCDIDRLLVVTFTNAAAGEMKERISQAIDAELEKAVKSGDAKRKNILKRQQLLLSVSDITTIDAFCLKLIRTHFNRLGIDPNFKIADEAQASILSDEAMEEVFSELYEENDDEFINLLCLYAKANNDDGLKDVVRYIYKFLCSVPQPEKWLYENVEALKDDIRTTLWYKELEQSNAEKIEQAVLSTYDALVNMCGVFDIQSFIKENPPEEGISVYDEWKGAYAAFYHDYTLYTSMRGKTTSELNTICESVAFPQLRFTKSKTDDEKAVYQALRKQSKDAFAKIKDFCKIPIDETNQISKEKLYPTAKGLMHLVRLYSKRYMQKKTERNILEFHDTEQLASRLLYENPDICEELKNRYVEILMDEYQDTSALQEEIFSYITNGRNLFTVGDMKQSIYRFRSSDPSIFKNRSDRYVNEDGAENRKIILSKNFRSRSEVIDSVNDVFSEIMSKKAGELDYDADQMLYLGNTSYPQTDSDYTAECLVIKLPSQELEKEDSPEKHILEARCIAAEINKLKREHFKVTTKDGVREIENKDIVILMSSYKSASDAFTSELSSAGIECFVESLGYFERNEVRLMISLLKIINNPYNDIPLLGVMRSPIASFTDDELVIIRKCKKGSFYGALKYLIQMNENGELSDSEQIKTAQKAELFQKNLTRYRGYARYMSCAKLVWTLYEETDFYAFSGAMYNGDEAQANLRLLFERAKQFESNGFQGLFNFVKYLEHIKNRETDLSSAKIVGDSHNVVRIMTMHKSKGLEFPVVFIAGGNTDFYKKTDETRIIMHRRYGIGMELIDYENSSRFDTPAKCALKNIFSAERQSEEIRKLYVAMTRAKEKLYFVAAVSGKSKDDKNIFMSEAYSISERTPKLFSPDDVLSSSSFADWVVPVAIKSNNWKMREMNYDSLPPVREDTKSDENTLYQNEIDIDYILDYRYPYSDVCNLPTKVSASSLKRDILTPIIPKPEFLQQVQAGGAAYGTAVHTVMQYLKPCEGMDKEYVKQAVSRLEAQGKLSRDEAAVINPEKILLFYQSDIGRRIIKSKNVVREQTFEVEIPAKTIYPELSKTTDENILLQGIIDCFFEEDDALVLVDYKTDKYKNKSEILEKYAKQLELYTYALEKITKKPVKEKFIYLFFDNSVV